ncbi:MAG TPA: HdeD family acid-resistance protein [Stellaceae bacterium]|nr:HdeD family acid-resistance protein [Stellaceae bacterium]
MVVRLLEQNWWALALRGAFAVVFGSLALAMPGLTLEVLILLFGFYALADGIFALIAAFRAVERHERWGVLALEGVVSLIAGLIALFIPLAAALAFLYVFAAWALLTGILEILAAIELRRAIAGEWLLILNGLLSVALGLFLMVFPTPGLLVLIWWIGIYAIIFGGVMIALGFRVRHLPPHATPIHL